MEKVNANWITTLIMETYIQGIATLDISQKKYDIEGKRLLFSPFIAINTNVLHKCLDGNDYMLLRCLQKIIAAIFNMI